MRTNELSNRYNCHVTDFGDGSYNIYYKCYSAHVFEYYQSYNNDKYNVTVYKNGKVEYQAETMFDYVNKEKLFSILDRYFPVKTIEEMKLF